MLDAATPPAAAHLALDDVEDVLHLSEAARAAHAEEPVTYTEE